jgi:group I intron endonuclease
MKEKPPRSSGVYQILCKATSKIYIGSTVNLRDRWAGHCSSLRCGKHPNVFLQRAWNKYGEAQFEFSVLEFIDEADLLRAEQRWIDETRCAERNIGFNISRVAGSTGDLFAQVWEGFIDPEGNELTITNLHRFCRQHGLDFPSMHRLAKGKSKLKSYKGWSHRNSIRQRDYVKTYEGFIDPEGRAVEPITNLADFCREHGLDNTHMVAVAHGRICSHRGWTHQNGRRKAVKIYTGFIDPDGQHVLITNIAAFCRANGLHPVRMFNLISGQRRKHKGWTWRNDD